MFPHITKDRIPIDSLFEIIALQLGERCLHLLDSLIQIFRGDIFELLRPFPFKFLHLLLSGSIGIDEGIRIVLTDVGNLPLAILNDQAQTPIEFL